MKKSLYIKFVIFCLFLGFIGFFTVSLLGPILVKRHLESVYSTNLYREASDIAQNRASLYYQNETSANSVFSSLKTISQYQDIEIWLISPQGAILLSSSQDMNTASTKTIENFNPGHNSGSYYQVGSFYGCFKEEQLSVMVPVSWQMKIQGYVAMHLPMSVLLEQQSHIMNIIYILITIVFLIMLLILVGFSFMIYRPLKKIIAGADAFASGDLKYNIPVNSQDEMGYLALTLNYMSDELDKMGEYQRKFVANVSHDFRSPLTSIRGYLEAMIDGTIPPEMHEKYLTIVLNETERLTKLTNSLLTLNNLNTKGMMLNKTDFDINTTIRNVAASFEGTCRQKMIAIELVLTGDEMYVEADMDKIQQVLYNLLDNAIKFSHHNSVIKIETTEKHNKIFVSVKDSGIGIPKDDLKLIWDRFYKSDLSRGKDKKGTGLGLSITKEIIRSHGEHINVISTEGVGTEFIFSLPKSGMEDED